MRSETPRPDILSPEEVPRAVHLAELLLIRHPDISFPTDDESRIQGLIELEIQESGWQNVTVQAVRDRMQAIHALMIGYQGYRASLANTLKSQFGIMNPEANS